MTSSDWYYGLPRTLDNIHRVASLTRDRLSLEAWRTLNDFYAGRRWQGSAMPRTIGDSLVPARRRLARAGGLPRPDAREHDPQLRLVVPGHGAAAVARRAPVRTAARHVRQGGAGADDIGSLSFVLELADSFITYRSRYRMAPVLPLVLDLLLVDESNPRSIAFQLAALSRHIDTLPQSGEGGGRIDEQRMALSLLTRVRVAQAQELAKAGPDGRRAELEALLDEQVAMLPHLSDAIGRRYFNLVEKDARWVRARSRVDG